MLSLFAMMTGIGWASMASALPGSASKGQPRQLHRRGIIDASQLLPSYDFIIAGGGLAGLVIASRLTEDSNTTVLVLEAGETGDDVRSRIDTPTDAYFNGLLGTKFDWKYQTTPQAGLNNRNVPWPRGKIVGGSSAVNGMYMVRPSAMEMDLWMKLQGDQDGAAAWGWESMFKAMKKSEKFTPPSPAIQTAGAIQYNPASHGTSGPLSYSFPGFLLPVVGEWTATLDMIGIPPSPDANGGSGWGAFIATSAINPTNWTRSYSRSAYIDPLPPRANLHILPNNTVTRILLSPDPAGNGLMKATGVEYANNGYQPKPWPTVNANKEVLLAAGAVGSPQLLMQSGVGPADILTKAGVPVLHALPGVGQHVQDHISSQVVFKTNVQTAATIHASGGDKANADGTNSPIQSFINSAIAYANVTDLLGDWAPELLSQILANKTSYAAQPAYNPSTDPTVTQGYLAIYQANADILNTQIGQLELLFALTGTFQGGPDSFAVQAALQHPFSQGQLYIQSPNPFDYPTIDPGYLSHIADLYMLREGLKLARKIGQTEPLSAAAISEVSPGPQVQTDADWDTWLRGVVGTEYHPSCTCAMLPLALGGVVDPYLKVYGLSNVRVTDSSVYPIQFAAHLMAPTYGLAEQASDIIKAQYSTKAASVSNQAATSGNTASKADASSSGDVQVKTGSGSNAAGSTRSVNGWWPIAGLTTLMAVGIAGLL